MFGKFFACFFVLLAAGFSARSQLLQVSRYEIPLGPQDEFNQKYAVVGLKAQGLMVYRRIQLRDENKIELTRLDTTLHEVWKGLIQIQRGYNLLHAEPKGEFLFLLFKDQQFAMGDFLMIAVRIATGDYGTYVVKNIIPFNPTEFIITKDAALIGGYFNYRPLILHFSLATQQSRILPGFFNEPGELTQIMANADGTVDVIVSARNADRRRSLWIRNYDGQGNLIKTVVLQPDEDKHLIFGRSLKTIGGEQVVSGVYGRSPEYSRGIFVARINDFGEYQIHYYNFGDLDRFFNYMRARREQRVKHRIERRKIKGKKIRFNYRFLVHQLIPYGDQFVMLGEAFYPHYSYPNSRTMGFMTPGFRTFNNPMMTRGELVFDGYQYTHAVLIGFDKEGNLNWDNSFEINDVRTFQLEQYVKIITEEDRLVLLYLFDNVIRSKIIKDSEVIEGKSFDQLKLQFTDDFVRPKNTEKPVLDYWFGDTLYASGIQYVQNGKLPSLATTRKVFFINKIVYK